MTFESVSYAFSIIMPLSREQPIIDFELLQVREVSKVLYTLMRQDQSPDFVWMDRQDQILNIVTAISQWRIDQAVCIESLWSSADLFYAPKLFPAPFNQIRGRWRLRQQIVFNGIRKDVGC